MWNLNIKTLQKIMTDIWNIKLLKYLKKRIVEERIQME